MRADHASGAGADPSQPVLQLSNGSGVGASVADRERLLPEAQLAADDVEHRDQFGWNQDRDVPMWSAYVGENRDARFTLNDRSERRRAVPLVPAIPQRV
jgi:hypothetical protein